MTTIKRKILFIMIPLLFLLSVCVTRIYDGPSQTALESVEEEAASARDEILTAHYISP